MKAVILALPMLAGALSGCNMVAMINESTCSIHANRETIDMDTEAICRNIDAIQESTRTIRENKRRLDMLNQAMNDEGGGK